MEKYSNHLGLMRISVGVSFWLLKIPSRYPEWLSFLVGGPGKASRNFYFFSVFEQKPSPVLTSGLTLYVHLLVDQELHPSHYLVPIIPSSQV